MLPANCSAGTPHLIHNRNVQVGKRVSFVYFKCLPEVKRPLPRPVMTVDKFVMLVILAESTAVGDHYAIEKRSISILGRLELAHEVGKLFKLTAVDVYALLDLLFIAVVMSESVVRVGDSDFAIRPVALLNGRQECDHACWVGLRGNRHQVEHHARVVAVVLRNTRSRLIEIRNNLRIAVFGFLNAGFDFADSVEVLVQLPAVSRSELSLQAFRVP